MSEQKRDDVTASADDYISISGVEDALISLWSKMAEAQPDEAMMRATTINLVLHLQNPNLSPAIIGEVTQANPCRAIVIESGSSVNGDSETLRAMPTLFCRPTLGRQARMQVCCEEILIRASQRAETYLAAAVQSMLLADLPVYVFREGELSPMDSLVTGLDEAIDGLIVDSSSFKSISSGLYNLTALVESSHDDLTLFDLNWQRLLPWRKGVARFFDNPNDRANLDHIESVEIVHTGPSAQGLLLLGWLVSRLGWGLVIERSTRNRWIAHSTHGEVVLTMRSEPSPDGNKKSALTDGLRAVTLTANGAKYAIALNADGTYCVSTGSQLHTQLPALLVPASSTGALIGAIIDQNRRDQVFEEALAVAATLSADSGALSQRAGIIVAEDAESLARLAARYFVQTAREAIQEHGRFTVALSGGSTPKAMFSLLAQSPYTEQVDWANVHVFWGDERDVPMDHKDSNQRMARETLLYKVPIPRENIHGLLTDELSAEEAAARYASDIRAFFKVSGTDLPEFDLILLGLGDDGHTASLFPHTEALKAEASRLVVANHVPQLNTMRITFTAGLINNATHVVFLVAGPSKSGILIEVFKGSLRPDDLPAQLIQPVSGALVVMADREAAAKAT